MLRKKGGDKKISEEEEIIKRVDEMMDPRAQVKPKPAVSPEPKTANSTTTPPPLDIFGNEDRAVTTAPMIPGSKIKLDAPIVPKSAPMLNPDPSTTVTEDISEVNEAPIAVTPISDDKSKTDAIERENDLPEENSSPLEIDESNQSINNQATDKAVREIVNEESDMLLAVQDAKAKEPSDTISKKPTKPASKLKRILKHKLTWLIILIIATLLIVPQTRYPILGLFVKKEVTIRVVDDANKTPVSNANIVVEGQSLTTDLQGEAKLKLAVGKHDSEIKKQYYKTNDQQVFVGIKGDNKHTVKLRATGRQVPVTVVNSITGKPVINAEVQALQTSVITDKKGQAVIVLPAKIDTADGLIKAKGFNNTRIVIRITDSPIKENNFSLTPSGKVYFLSNKTGKIDVVKSNLDGSDRRVVFEGTGREEPGNTNLLASRDWRYVLLKTKRDNTRPSLFLIDTSTDKITPVDTSNVEFDLIGWYGHNFMYSVVNNEISQSKSGRQIVKSYNAEKNQSTQVDQSKAEGSPISYAYQSFDNFHILNNILTYTTQWNVYDATGNGFNLAGRNNTIRGVQPNGQNKKDYQNLPTTNSGYIRSAQFGPQTVYYSFYNTDNGQTTYYTFDGQTASSINNIDQSDMNKSYPTYLVSPAGTQTLWSDVRDGKHTLFLGDNNGKKPKQIPSNGDFAPYGWLNDELILVSKGNNQLFVMPVEGLVANRLPLKISDYYRPITTFSGYGYGYGGL